MNQIKRIIEKIPQVVASRVSNKLHDVIWTSPDYQSNAPVTLVDIDKFLTGAGIGSGSNLFVHSSWDNLSGGDFSTVDLISSLLSLIGTNGTLAMPAFPHPSKQANGSIFDQRKTPSNAGLLTETFRRYPGVVRSINLNHSVCAIGPDAEYLTCDHHRSETSWDAYSPYYRLREFDDTWIIGLGVGHRLKVATSLHCAESILWKENKYFNKVFGKELCYTYKKLTGETGEHCYKTRIGEIYTPKIAKYFGPEELIEDTVRGLEVYAIQARTLIDKTIALGRAGKTMYVWPVPWRWNFR